MAIPQYYYQSATQVTPAWLAQHKLTALVVDLDNTVLPRFTRDIPADILAWAQSLGAAQIPVVLLSNNHKKRVQYYAELLGFIPLANAAKPLPFGYLRALHAVGRPRHEVAMLGDQFFTDMLGAAILGMTSIMVLPLSQRDLAHTLFLRKLERLVMGARKAEGISLRAGEG